MGTPVLAQEILIELHAAGYRIIGAYTKMDKPQGRKMEVQKSPVKIAAEKLGIPVFQPNTFDDRTVAQLRELNPDLIVVAAYGKILPKTVLEVAPLGAINVHTSLLPKFRGASPIQNALLQGEQETGVTIMRMDEGMDTGDILVQGTIPIAANDDCATLTKKLTRLGSDLLLRAIPGVANHEITPVPQSSHEATLCKLIKRSDGRIDWKNDASVIFNTYRALSPWPGVFTLWNNGNTPRRLKLLSLSLSDAFDIENETAIPGTVFQTQGSEIALQCGKGYLILHEIQIEGKKPMLVKDFTNGYKNFIGSVLS